MSWKSIYFCALAIASAKLVGALTHEGLEEVTRLETHDQCHELGFISGLKHCDGFPIETRYIPTQAFFRALLYTEQVGYGTFYSAVRYEMAQELNAEGVEVVYCASR